MLQAAKGYEYLARAASDRAQKCDLRLYHTKLEGGLTQSNAVLTGRRLF